MDGKFLDGEEQTTQVFQLDLNGNLVLPKQLNIGYLQLQQVQLQFIKEKNLMNGMAMR